MTPQNWGNYDFSIRQYLCNILLSDFKKNLKEDGLADLKKKVVFFLSILNVLHPISLFFMALRGYFNPIVVLIFQLIFHISINCFIRWKYIRLKVLFIFKSTPHEKYFFFKKILRQQIYIEKHRAKWSNAYPQRWCLKMTTIFWELADLRNPFNSSNKHQS